MAKESLVEKVYKEVKQEIRDGKITKEDCIVENDLCKNHDVSKATAGEVLHRLTQEGLLKSYPRKGYMLNVYSEEDFTKIQHLRYAIETLVVHKLVNEVDTSKVRRAFKNLNTMDNITFHSTMAKLLEDSFVEETLDNLLTKASNTFDHIDFDDGADKVINERHQILIDAVLERDESKAMEALRTDLRINYLDSPLGELGQWKMRKGFTTNTMKDIVYIADPQISADGKYAAIVKYKANTEDGKFYSRVSVYKINNGEVQLELSDGNCKAPVFLKDGTTVAYLSDISGEFQVYTKRFDGAEQKHTSLRHGVKTFQFDAEEEMIVFDANLWTTEVEAGLAFQEMSVSEKEEWKQEQEWAPKEITQIDYKRDECKGVRDGSISFIGLVEKDGEQKLLTHRIPYDFPVFSPDAKTIVCYGMPHTGAFYSSKELMKISLVDGSIKCLTDKASLAGDVAPAFTEDGASVIYPAYYVDGEKGTMILYLYMIPTEGGDSVCLFDPDAREVSSGVYGMPLSRTQYGQEKTYFQVSGNEIYFLCAWQGCERLYKMPIKEKSIPKLVLEGDFSIHEFCLPVKGTLLLTRGDYYNIRELYRYHAKTRHFVKITDHNPWMKEFDLGKVTPVDVPTKDGKASIHGAICYPVHFQEGKKYPAVLYVHGGPTVCYTNDFWHEVQILANAGYVVLTCDPRGSFGYGLEFANSGDSWGMPAYEDLMGFLDYAVSLGFIDDKRVGITGGSYGGYMTCKIVMMTNRFAAAVGQRVFVNKATSYGTGDMGFYSASQPYDTVQVKQCLIDRARSSIIKDMDRITTPMLFLHGYADYRCSFEQAEQMFISIKQRRPEVPVKLVMFPHENHGVSRTGLLHFQQRHVQEMVEWFDLYLKGAENV